MVGLIFGGIFLIAGIVASCIFYSYTAIEEKRVDLVDENGSIVLDRYGDPKYRKEKVTTYPLRKYALYSLFGGLFLALLLTFFGCSGTVKTGHTGVVTVFGKVEDKTFDAGFNMKAPWESVIQMDNRVQKAEIELSCFSSDIQEVTCKYTLNYQINKANAQNLYKTVGKDYYGTAIAPTVAESVKAIMAQYTAEQLIGSRSDLASAIEDLLKEQLTRYNIEVVSTAIEDIDFTDSFTNAVEQKQVAAQNKLKAEIEQEQAKKQAEADAQVAKTKADADAEVSKTKAKADAEIAQIQAQADLEVQKINANASEYTGQKEAAVVMNRLAGINGWNVKTDSETGTCKLIKSDGSDVSETERAEGVKRLIEYYYTQSWDGKLPETFVGDDVSSVLIGK